MSVERNAQSVSYLKHMEKIVKLRKIKLNVCFARIYVLQEDNKKLRSINRHRKVSGKHLKLPKPTLSQNISKTVLP